jgi:hypothetical protein
MQFLTQKAMARRTFLQGLGATIALPYLDAMLPAGRVSRFAKAMAPTAGSRFIAIEMVHGAAGSNAWGASKYLWAPQGLGRKFELNPDGALSPLTPWRDYLTIVSNTDCRMAEAFEAPERVPISTSARRSTKSSRAASGRTPRFRRCSSASRISIRPAAAITTTRARTPTRSAGRRPTNRCR